METFEPRKPSLTTRVKIPSLSSTLYKPSTKEVASLLPLRKQLISSENTSHEDFVAWVLVGKAVCVPVNDFPFYLNMF